MTARSIIGTVAGLAGVVAFGLFVGLVAINVALGCGDGGACWIIGR